MASWPILLRVLANIVNVRSIYGLPYDHCWLPLWHCLRASHAWAIWPPCASCFFLLWLLYTDLRAAVLFHKPRPQQYHYDTRTNCTSLHLSGYSLPTRPAVVWHRCHEGGRWWVRMSTRWGGTQAVPHSTGLVSGVYKALGLAEPLILPCTVGVPACTHTAPQKTRVKTFLGPGAGNPRGA
jgi:hypothetical protein